LKSVENRREVIVEILPLKVFYDWMKECGKEGGQNKFPRVLKKDQHTKWNNFIKENRRIN